MVNCSESCGVDPENQAAAVPGSGARGKVSNRHDRPGGGRKLTGRRAKTQGNQLRCWPQLRTEAFVGWRDWRAPRLLIVSGLRASPDHRLRVIFPQH